MKNSRVVIPPTHGTACMLRLCCTWYIYMEVLLSSGLNRVYPMPLWPRSGTFLFQWTAKAPGRHLIGRRRAPPDAGHFFAGYTRFWLLTPQEVPDYCTHLPKNGQILRPQRPVCLSRCLLNGGARRSSETHAITPARYDKGTIATNHTAATGERG